ncbi:cupin domain-containing protein [Anaerocolumna sedimenticola]|uniref:Cupin domain-containing protein n=1 Tax=Anaerocolumna sedimenticola TaxID=2696063 RepID=A0A6P1TJ73_9FIRM|nr:cupin domain-containing protein [Anaerocolumna sedimenticola]QHQ60132.1 cupin domain-containing protein [Anaerocolumna sedimenticola]
MDNIFPEPITKLPVADMPFTNYEAYISQSENHQIIFMKFNEDIELPEHSHESQWGIVLEGKIELTINGITNIYTKGDRYFIGKGIKHSGKIYSGYADMTFFNEKNRYSTK